MKRAIASLLVFLIVIMLAACSSCEHDFQQVFVTDASCTSEGSILFACSQCGEEMTESIKMKAHTYESKVTAEPSCAKEGVMTYTCTDCKATYTEAIAKVAHSYDAGTISTEATCTKEGVMTYTCADCKATYTEAIAKIAHSYDAGTVSTEATCTKEGVMTYTCADCKATHTEAIAKAAHSYEEEKKVSPTCTENGYTQYTCSVCGDSYTDVDSYAVGHAWGTWEVTKIPNYTEAGEHKHICSACGVEERISLGCLVMTPEAIQREILRLVNMEREKAGVAPLEYYSRAQIAADARAQDLLLQFSHTRPDGTICFDALDDYNIYSGYIAGENIAMGYPNAETVMNGWMNSPGHRTNILNPNYTHIVIGGVDSRWVQLFFGLS